MKICLLMLGKTRRPEMVSALGEYVKRVSRSCPIEVVEARDAAAVLKRLEVNRAAVSALLDAGGKVYDSDAFAKWLGEHRDRGIREVIFICGDADGFPESLRERVKQKLSLSAMTYSHELARVMLAEQIYRAFAILSGSPYPK
ncbi:MAG TPA: 23S rRNA (pseudouridine(1915)-N(3))-methyltransferase RlmH [Methylomirabilota bacterium]|jgi:23S rRNA (pseudouridine1915-N3)-methyltransferase|nr:23S rRNA (pseudouridine(1915)-N(3))-methyltransferase RlmH [Methylomirabilota bacterium]